MYLGIKSQRTTYHSFPLCLVKRCQVLLDMAAQNNVTASQTTPLIWPHLLVWERLSGPAEVENAFWQLTNESVALGYRSLPGGCAPSVLWVTDLPLQLFSDLLACRVFRTVLAALCNELGSLCKGRWTDLFTKTTLAVVPSPSLPSSVRLPLCQTLIPPSSSPLSPSPSYQPYKHKDTVYIQVSYYSLPLVPCFLNPQPPTPCLFTPTVPPLWVYSNEAPHPSFFLYCHNMINAVFAEGNYCQQKGRATDKVITTDHCMHFLLCHYPPPPPPHLDGELRGNRFVERSAE